MASTLGKVARSSQVIFRTSIRGYRIMHPIKRWACGFLEIARFAFDQFRGVMKFHPMTYSLKILIAICMTTLSVAIVSAYSVYWVAYKQLIDQLQDKLATTATVAATLLETDDFKTVLREQHNESAAFGRLVEYLRAFSEQDENIQYVYTVVERPDTKYSGVVEFLVDASVPEDSNANGVIDDDERVADVGELYNASMNAPRMLDGFEGPAFDDEPVQDAWGWFMSGYAPIVDEDGTVLGVVGIDMAVSQLRVMRNEFLSQCIFVVMAVLATGVIISLIISRAIARPVRCLDAAFKKVAEGDMDVKLELNSGAEFRRLADSFNQMVTDVHQRNQILGTLESIMSKEVAEIVMQDESLLNQAKRKRVTILFCDIRGMTTLAEQESPEKISRILEVFYDAMIDTVFEHKGIVDKLLGDGLMALFGTPVDNLDQEESALNCALMMQDRMTDVRKKLDMAELRIGVGVHTGVVIAGSVGSHRLKDYTVIGDTVNVASRLEGESRYHDSGIVVSERVVDGLMHLYDLKEIGAVELKNRKKTVPAFELIDHKNVSCGVASTS
jgi:adenylate cyclase